MEHSCYDCAYEDSLSENHPCIACKVLDPKCTRYFWVPQGDCLGDCLDICDKCRTRLYEFGPSADLCEKCI